MGEKEFARGTHAYLGDQVKVIITVFLLALTLNIHAQIITCQIEFTTPVTPNVVVQLQRRLSRMKMGDQKGIAGNLGRRRCGHRMEFGE